MFILISNCCILNRNSIPFYCFQHPPRIELILKVFSDILLIELSLTFEEIAG